MALAMRFISDNAAPACPAVMRSLGEANRVDIAYDGDAWSQRLDAAFSVLFETEVAVLWVATGTAANCLALNAMCPPTGGVICHRDAHIEVDEGGAPGFYTHGAKLMLLEGEGAKISPAAIAALCDRIGPDIHQVQPAVISITNATEYGLTYRAAEVVAIGAEARHRGLGLHMDGARIANAVAFAGESLAEVTWRAGVAALSFGFVKNGGMNAEALVFFDPALAEGARRMRKRAGHLQSKGRFLAAQLLAMIEGDLWLANARSANVAATVLAEAAGYDRLIYPVEANELFLRMTTVEAAALREQGFDFYDWRAGEVRLVTSWDQDRGAVERLAAAIRAL